MDNVTAAVVVGAVAVVAAVREVTWRRAMAETRRTLAATESAAMQGEKLAAVGQLVSGLAQELRSPLQGLIGSTELMLASAGQGDPADSGELQQMVDEASRAAGLVRSLLAFTETASLARRWQDLNEIVARAVNACQAELAATGVRTQFLRADRLPLVYVDGRQLEKVLTMLLSRCELGKPGCVSSLTVTTCGGQSPEDPLAISIDEEGALSDSDCHATWSSGLAACQQVMDAHGGSLAVERRTAGLRIRLELPIAVADGTGKTGRERALHGPDRGGTAAASPRVETRS